jgi:hypothetical protein
MGRGGMNTGRLGMILGMSTAMFTLVHVLISLVGILSGFLVLFGMIGRKVSVFWTATFFITNALTDVTGFMFPFKQVTPGIIIGILSLIVLAIAGLVRKKRGAYVAAIAVALYFNVFVLIVQSFEKIAALKEIAPTQASPVFGITQLVVLVLYVIFVLTAWRRYRTA